LTFELGREPTGDQIGMGVRGRGKEAKETTAEKIESDKTKCVSKDRRKLGDIWRNPRSDEGSL